MTDRKVHVLIDEDGWTLCGRNNWDHELEYAEEIPKDVTCKRCKAKLSKEK